VKFVAGLSADLATLSQTLEDPSLDIHGELRRLGETLALASASFSGLTLTVHVGEQRFGLTAWAGVPEAAPVASSMRLPLPAVSRSLTGGELIVYAAARGAFVDLAADLRRVLQGDPEELVVMDGHLDPAAIVSGTANLSTLATVNQAVGILIAQGMLREAAHDELHHRARSANTTVSEAAADLIRAVTA